MKYRVLLTQMLMDEPKTIYADFDKLATATEFLEMALLYCPDISVTIHPLEEDM